MSTTDEPRPREQNRWHGWSATDFRRHVPRIIAERDAAVAALAAAEQREAALRDAIQAFADISERVTESYPDDVRAVPELVMRRRVGKIGNEYGELLDAIEGWTGENPRKGMYATREDVIKELLDCASASLCAVEHLTGDAGRAVGLLFDQIKSNAERLFTALDRDA